MNNKDTLKETRDWLEEIKNRTILNEELKQYIDYVNLEIIKSRRTDLRLIKYY